MAGPLTTQQKIDALIALRDSGFSEGTIEGIQVRLRSPAEFDRLIGNLKQQLAAEQGGTPPITRFNIAIDGGTCW